MLRIQAVPIMSVDTVEEFSDRDLHLEDFDFPEESAPSTAANSGRGTPARSVTEADDFEIVEDPPSEGKRSHRGGKSSPAGLETDDFQIEDSSAEPTCEKCGTTEPWGMASWCPACGYSPRYGIVTNKPEEQGHASQEVENWWQAVPIWAWGVGGGVLGIFLLGVILRVATQDGSPQRFWIAMTMALGGFVAFSIAHLQSYLKAAPKTDKLSPWDLFMKPLEIWKYTLNELPTSTKRLWCGSWSVTSIVTGLLIVGGIRYSAMFDDWGFKKGAQPNLMHAIVEEARKAEAGEGDLEDSMNDFAGKAMGEEEEKKVVIVETDCLIVGYTTNNSGELEKLILASLVGEHLRYVGTLSASTLPEEDQRELASRMPEYQRSKPLVKNPYAEATWLKPVMMLRVEHEEWTPSKELKKPKFHSLLRDIRS